MKTVTMENFTWLTQMMTVLANNFTWLIQMMTVLMKNFTWLNQMWLFLYTELNYTDPDDDSNRKELIELIQMMTELGKNFTWMTVWQEIMLMLSQNFLPSSLYTEAARTLQYTYK